MVGPRRSHDRRGRTVLGCAALLILLGVAGYVGVAFGRVYFRYFSFKDIMAVEARFASQLSDTEIHSRLVRAADSLHVPLAPSELRIVRIARTISISANYRELVRFPLVSHELHFTPDVRREF